MKTLLDTGIRNARNLQQYTIANGSISDLSKLISNQSSTNDVIVFFYR